MKFSSDRAESLWLATLDSTHDGDFGHCDTFGWFARFDDELAIIETDQLGFVYLHEFDTLDSLMIFWNERESEWLTYDQEEEDWDEYEYEDYGYDADDFMHGDSDLWDEY